MCSFVLGINEILLLFFFHDCSHPDLHDSAVLVSGATNV